MRQGISDCRSDVYSLAATIYYCLLYDDPVKRGCFEVELLPADFPPDVGALLKRCLHGYPDGRPRDAAAFLQEWSRPKPAQVVTPPQPKVVTPAQRKAGEIVTNSLSMKFAWIPPGEFDMGSPATEKDRRDDEIQHRVTLTQGFFLGITPVTQTQWRAVGGTERSSFKGDDRPVENVSWEDCQEFCKLLSQKDGKPYRLPTEAEWEYACRAGTTTPFSFGETISTDQVNYDGCHSDYDRLRKGVYRQQTTPVGSFPTNAWGLYDMHGNVWEWCQDWYGSYPSSDITDPQGEKYGESRVLRGGSWDDCASNCRAAYRRRVTPGRRRRIGFRVCFRLD